MIGYLSGKVKFLFDDGCILDVHGVGYKVFVATPNFLFTRRLGKTR